MNKILSSLGLAVLGIAILVGAAAAADTDSKPAIVTGTVEEITMSISQAPAGTTDLGTFVKTANAAKTGSDSLKITSNAPWALTVKDSNIASSDFAGYMRKYTGSSYGSSGSQVKLTNGFKVNDYDLSPSGTKTLIANQAAGTDISQSISYSQSFDSASDGPGSYRIDLTYSIAYSP